MLKTIKKIILILFIGVIPSGIFAQTFSPGTNVLQAGLSLGFHSPILNLSYERGIKDNIGIGGVFGYMSYSSPYLTGKWNYSYTYIGFRGSYHFNDLLKLNLEKADLYGGLTLHYAAVSVKASGGVAYTGPSLGSVGLSAFVGGRYYFSPQFGAFAELGYGMGFGNLGVCYKF